MIATIVGIAISSLLFLDDRHANADALSSLEAEFKSHQTRFEIYLCEDEISCIEKRQWQYLREWGRDKATWPDQIQSEYQELETRKHQLERQLEGKRKKYGGG